MNTIKLLITIILLMTPLSVFSSDCSSLQKYQRGLNLPSQLDELTSLTAVEVNCNDKVIVYRKQIVFTDEFIRKNLIKSSEQAKVFPGGERELLIVFRDILNDNLLDQIEDTANVRWKSALCANNALITRGWTLINLLYTNTRQLKLVASWISCADYGGGSFS